MEQHLLNCVPIWVVAYGQNFEVKMGGPSQSPGEKSPAMVLEILLKKLMLTTISRVCFGYKDISRKRKKTNPGIAGIQSTNKLANQNPVPFTRKSVGFGVFAGKFLRGLVISFEKKT